MKGTTHQQQLILITGPTASGKTKMSIQLAQFLLKNGIDAQVINFDSLLFYKEISIGTAKPSEKEKEGIPHHLIAVNSITEEFNASHYIDLAKSLIDELHTKNIVPILVGGSAFYLRALMKGMYEEETSNERDKEAIKQKWKDLLQTAGIQPIIEFLKENDPDALNLFHSNDHYRLTRAAEHFDLTGEKISEKKKQFDDLDPYDFSTSPYHFIHFYLDLPKDEHFPYIVKRVEEMFKLGLVNEVQNLLAQGYAKSLKPLQSIGYKETISFLDGEIKDLSELKELIAIHTRQLAKSQRTFFKKITPKIELNPLLDREKIENLSLEFIKNCE